jgi:hypothetical protein
MKLEDIDPDNEKASLIKHFISKSKSSSSSQDEMIDLALNELT